MVDSIISKPIGLVLLATAHIVCNGPGPAEVTGILGSNITLNFMFNDTVISNNNHFAIYKTGHNKIAEYLKSKGGIGGGVFDIYRNICIQYHITDLKENQSGIYWATLFGLGPPKESNTVRLIVQLENRNSTVSPLASNVSIIKEDGSPSLFSFHIVTVLVVSPVVLLAAVLPLLIWRLMRAKDTQQQQQQQPQQNSNTTVQEIVEESNSAPPPALVYSVLDFPKRPPTPLHVNPRDTEYANVNCLPEKRHI